jgi:hypothetical protein
MSKVIMTETKIKSIVSNIIEKINNDNFILENNNNKLNNIITKEIKLACNSEKLIYEGIGYDNYTHEVWYTDSEDSVDTSLITNPTKDETIISGVNVYSIFQRKNTPDANKFDNQDGNPLLYAFKEEKKWHFKSNKDKQKFIQLFEQIVDKFLQMYQTDITIVMPTGSHLNNMIAQTILNKDNNAHIINDLLRKLTIEEVWESIEAIDSPFRKKFGRTRNDWENACKDIQNAFVKMQRERNGKFTYHMLPTNKPYREYITQTLSCDEYSRGKYANEIYGHNILLLDDSISRGASIKNACDILNTFQPKSITVLTMFSKKKI